MLSLDPKYLQRLVETSPDIVVAVNQQGSVIYYNDGARAGLQFPPEEVVGHDVRMLYRSPQDARLVMQAMRANHGQIASFETVFRNKAGQSIPVAISGSLIYDEQGHEIGSIGFARDIRELRRREQLATAGEIAVCLAHEINNPLAAILNNVDLLARAVEGHLSDAELVVESERLESIRSGVARVQEIIVRLDEMARQGTYETRDYVQGRRMVDLPTPVAAEVLAVSEWPLSGMVVLVLDDDPTVVTSLADVLKAERCVVYTALRPSSALAILRNVKVDAVISDVVMPEMDGYEFYLQVREELPALPVVRRTAYHYDKDHIIKRSRLEGLEGAIFKKPVNPVKLREILLHARQHNAAALALKPPPGPQVPLTNSRP